MKGKQLFILLLIAALAVGAWYYVSGRNLGTSPAARSGGKVVDFPINEVAQIKIKNSGGEVNVLKKGDTWVVKERSDYPANFEQVSGLVRKVWELKPGQDTKAGPSQWARLELVEPGKGEKTGTLLEFLGADGKSLAGLVLGKKQTRQDGGGDEMGMAGAGGFPLGRFVKPAAGNTVSLVTELFDDVEPKPERWIAKDFIKVEGAKSVSVTGQADTQKWTVTRESPTGEWKLADAKPDEKIDTNKTFALGSILSAPNVNDLVAPDAKPEDTGLDKPTLARIETFDGFVYDLKIGKVNGGNVAVIANVSANLPKERAPGKDEKPEDKAKLDEEFKNKQKKLEEKLANEQKFANRAFLLSSFSVDSLLKDRAGLLADKPAEPAAPEGTPPGVPPVPGAAPVPVPAPGAAPMPAPATPPSANPPPPALPAPAPKPADAPEAKPEPKPATPPPAPDAAPAPAPKPDAPPKPEAAPTPANPAPGAPAGPGASPAPAPETAPAPPVPSPAPDAPKPPANPAEKP